ncbi:hypothetical protein CQ018_14595 [Arthrobacter sp. MYb227]|uniref:hypothetical protein n=1 Tax=Arthrobacter sp. MYb227 TaxID=1848601 RepID=UPI000D4D4016|nr:hypothetical protein [Arthrobacter sp. MYb227]PQZ90222.1 hypothetical protein CQ018_14595 [Arthrobacter sp. MYb227]
MSEVLVVQIRRSGGVTGISRTGKLVLPLVGRSVPDDRWSHLAVAAREQLRAAPQTPAGSLIRDAFTWILSFNEETYLVTDSQLTGAAKNLAEHVLKISITEHPDPRFGDQ